MLNKSFKIIIYSIAIIIIVDVGLFLFFKNKNVKSNMTSVSPANIIAISDPKIVATSPAKNIPVPVAVKKIIAEPITNALARITKKSFGIHISPGHSPVSPERFTGYHTGVDFEATADEANIAVPIYAICTGTLAIKETALGYGGMAVERCKISGQDVTVVYGHLKLTSIVAKVGDKLFAGEQLAILGQGYSAETAGERKHLHLGIHKGIAINTSGYVSSASQLTGWIDIEKYLK